MKSINSFQDYIKYYKKNKKIILFWQIIIITSFLILWEFLSLKKIINPFIYSSPSRIIKELIHLYNSHNLWKHIITTLIEIIISFFIGTFLGLLIAIIFYLHPKIAKIFDPYLTILNSLPKVALGPIIIIIFGAMKKSIIIMATLINLVVNIVTIYTGFQKTDTLKTKLFNSFGATKKQKLTMLVLPSALNDIIASLKLNISLTMIGVITGEFLVSKAGIGYLIIYGTQVFNLDLVISGIFLLLITSSLLYLLVAHIENKFLSKRK